MERRPELIDYIAVVSRRWRFILGGTLLLTASAVLATLLMTPYYATEATLLVARSKVSAEGKDPPRHASEVDSYLSLIENNSIYLEAIEEFGLRETPWRLTLPKFSRLVSVRHVPGSDLIGLRFSFPDPDKSRQIAAFLVQRAIERNRALNQAEAIETQKFLEQELEQARQRRERLNSELVAYRRSADTTALEARLKAFTRAFEKLDTQRHKAEADLAEAEAGWLGVFELSGLQARLKRLEQSLAAQERQADAWSQEYAARKQTIRDLSDRYETADRVYRQLAMRTNEALVLVGSRSQDLKLLDEPFRPERKSWPRQGLVAAVVSQVSLLGMTLLAFLLDYIASRRSRL
jgi:uncharacterized protein involved in exopolysaccharide biosynthesis